MTPGHRRLRSPIGVLRELFGEPASGEDAGEKASRVFFVETPHGEITVRDWHKAEWGPGAPSCESDTRYVWNVFGPEGALDAFCRDTSAKVIAALRARSTSLGADARAELNALLRAGVPISEAAKKIRDRPREASPVDLSAWEWPSGIDPNEP